MNEPTEINVGTMHIPNVPEEKKVSLESSNADAELASKPLENDIRRCTALEDACRMTFSEYMRGLESFPKAWNLWAQTESEKDQMRRLFGRWRLAGYPDLGEWPVENTTWDEWEASLGF